MRPAVRAVKRKFVANRVKAATRESVFVGIGIVALVVIPNTAVVPKALGTEIQSAY
jgi:hypothetical protein